MGYSQDTICVQGGWQPKNGEPRVLPIYQSTTFKYATSEEMGKLFDLEEEGYFYSRLQNPTNDVVAQKICDLEGGVAAMLTSSYASYMVNTTPSSSNCGFNFLFTSSTVFNT